MRYTLSRFRPVLIAVTLGVSFLAAVLTFNDSLWKTTETHLQDALTDYTYVASVSGPVEESGPADTDLRTTLGDVSGVEAVQPSVDSIGFVQRGTLTDPVQLRSLVWLADDASLVAGALPQDTGEVVIDASVAADWDFSAGDTLGLLRAVDDTKPGQLTVSGIVETPDAAIPGADTTVYGAVETLNAARDLPADTYSQVFIKASNDAKTRDMLQDMASAADQDLTVEPVEDFIADQAGSALPGTQYIQMGLAGVSVAAFLVLVLVIRSVFLVRIEQDRRDYSLRRCLGATRAQVFGTVLASAAGMGLIGSILGAALAHGVLSAVFATSVVPMTFGTSLGSIVGAIVAGTVVCVIGALGPARQAMANTPLGALRDAAQPDPVTTGTQRRPILRISLFILAVALLILTAYTGILVATIGMAVVVIVIGLTLIQPVTHSLAKVFQRRGFVQRSVPGSEALQRIATHPARAASITSLTAITVAFIALIGTGSATALASMNKVFTDVPLADVEVTFDHDQLDADQILESVASVEAVDTSTVVQTRSVDVAANAHEIAGATAVKITPELTAVVNVPHYLETVEPNTVLLGESFEIGDGSSLTLTAAQTTQQLTADVRPEGTDYAFLTASDFEAFNSPIGSQVWVQFDDAVDTQDAIDQLSGALSDDPVSYQGTSQQVAELDTYIGLLTVVALLLLAVGVLIALIGISNTLRVSIIERTQEIGLQCALGALRSDIRRSLVIETLVLTTLGAVLGAVAGAFIAISGVYSLVTMISGLRFGLDIPAGFLAIMLVVTILVGIAAALLASRRAIRISPVQAIVSN